MPKQDEIDDDSKAAIDFLWDYTEFLVERGAVELSVKTRKRLLNAYLDVMPARYDKKEKEKRNV